MGEKAKSDLKSRIIHTVYDQKSRDKAGSGIKLVAIQYYKPGARLSEKKESSVLWGVVSYWIDEETKLERWKPKNNAERDFDELEKIDAATKKTVYSTLKALVKTPPPIPVEPAATPAPAAAAEDVPFS